jgi:hypothetical protein
MNPNCREYSRLSGFPARPAACPSIRTIGNYGKSSVFGLPLEETNWHFSISHECGG